MTASDRVVSFLDSYRHAFEKFDAEAIADHFGFPCHIAGDAETVDLTCLSDRQELLGTLTMLLDVYRGAAVVTAAVISMHATSVSHRLIQVAVHWSLRNAADEEIYDFHGAYTLAEVDREVRIVAIAHDELPKIMRLLGQAR